MVMSYFRPELEIWPFHACAVKNMQFNPHVWRNCRNFRVLKKIRVEKYDGDVRFKSGSGNMAVSCMHSASSQIMGTRCSLLELADATFHRMYF